MLASFYLTTFSFVKQTVAAHKRKCCQTLLQRTNKQRAGQVGLWQLLYLKAIHNVDTITFISSHRDKLFREKEERTIPLRVASLIAMQPFCRTSAHILILLRPIHSKLLLFGCISLFFFLVPAHSQLVCIN